jgi:hypothetical protein
MRKQQQEIKRHFYRLAFSDVTNEQILKAYKQGELSLALLRPSQFIRHLVILGLEKYQAQERNRTAQLETRLQAAGCETALEAIQRIETKIIPFPGVTLNHEVTYQNALDSNPQGGAQVTDTCAIAPAARRRPDSNGRG